jgi:hypothetical protein
LLFEALFMFLFSSSWLISPQDPIVPIIGFTVIVTIIVVLVIVIVKWYQYWVKKGLEEYKREHGET